MLVLLADLGLAGLTVFPGARYGPAFGIMELCRDVVLLLCNGPTRVGGSTVKGDA